MSENISINFKPNYDYFLDAGDGDISFLVEILDLFLMQTPEQLTLIEHSIKIQDWSAIKDVAHKIKATFRMLGLTEIANIWNSIEKNASEIQNQSFIQKEFKIISPLVEKLITIIKKDREEFSKEF